MKYQYKSHRAKYIEKYLNYKRTLGYSFNQEHLFYGFDRFFISMNKTDSIGITKEECEEWSKKRTTEKDVTHYTRINDLIKFSTYLQLLGFESQTPMRIKKIVNFEPYIFTKLEILQIFKAAESLTVEKPHSGRNILSSYFKLLYSTGIRKSEGLNLTVSDVDLEARTILVRNTKNGRDRILPLSSSLFNELKAYSNKYNINAAPDDIFFRNMDNMQITSRCVNRWFKNILRYAGIPYIGGGHGPRIHDVRFTFCCHSLKQLIDRGIDMYVFLPILSQYMGHTKITSTEYYLKLTRAIYPELIDQRSKLEYEVFPEVPKNENN